jgi:Zn-finger protein
MNDLIKKANAMLADSLTPDEARDLILNLLAALTREPDAGDVESCDCNPNGFIRMNCTICNWQEKPVKNCIFCKGNDAGDLIKDLQSCELIHRGGAYVQVPPSLLAKTIETISAMPKQPVKAGEAK